MKNSLESIEKLCMMNIVKIFFLVCGICYGQFSSEVEEIFLILILILGINTIKAAIFNVIEEEKHSIGVIVYVILITLGILSGGVYYYQQNILLEYMRDFVLALCLEMSDVIVAGLRELKTKFLG